MENRGINMAAEEMMKAEECVCIDDGLHRSQY
jgi:hypothetical protein